MSETHFTGGKGAIWIQPDGPATDMIYLGCHEIASISEPLGDYTPFFCPDPSAVSRWLESGETSAPPEAVTAQVMEDVLGTLSYLERQKCPFPLYINMVCGGRKDVFTNYERTFILDTRKITNRNYDNLALKDTDERATITHDIGAAPPLIKVVNISSVEQAIPDATATGTQEAVNDIWICKDESCAGQCSDSVGLCDELMIVCDAPAAGTADVVTSINGGGTWTNTAAQPFAADEDIISGVCFSKDQSTTRRMVVRGVETGTPANPAEIAYSDDNGATWTNVDVEATGTRYANDSGALFVLDPKHIWLVLTDGYIYFTSDMGVTWTNQEDGTVTTENYNAVEFVNINDGFAVADNGIVVRTTDGGNTWVTVTAISGTPNITGLEVFNKDDVQVGDDNGVVWQSFDGGTTWTSTYSGSTAINDIAYANRFVGMILDGTTVLRTRNGGEDWETVSGTPSATEFNAVVACDENTFYVVGEDASNNGIVLKISG